jgi:hypothetical protein
MLHTVKVYGLGRCPRTVRITGLLRALDVPFDYFDLNADRHAAQWVRWRNGPHAVQTPTVMVGLRVMANPTETELATAVADLCAAGTRARVRAIA